MSQNTLYERRKQVCDARFFQMFERIDQIFGRFEQKSPKLVSEKNVVNLLLVPPEQYLGPRRKGVKEYPFRKIAMTKRSLTL